MKTVLAVAAAMLIATSTVDAADVGVSIAISQPGVYGRIDIGHFPQPAVIVPQPMIIATQPVVVAPQPVYMWVPKEHRKNWGRYCRQYGACGVPVYFVRHDWYNEHVRHADHRRGDWDDDHGKGKGGGKGKGKGKKDD
jgi:hypothetical protein